MNKKISDYLHLYLGCDILILKSNYYFVHELCIHKDAKKELSPYILSKIHNNGKGIEIKLILRPLSDMTEQEAVEFAALTEWPPHFRDVKVERNKFSNDIIVKWDGANEGGEVVNATGDLFWCSEQFLWLIEKRFDIFQLIESNLAIDKTTLIPSIHPK